MLAAMRVCPLKKDGGIMVDFKRDAHLQLPIDVTVQPTDGACLDWTRSPACRRENNAEFFEPALQPAV
jgi:hypothetical protein